MIGIAIYKKANGEFSGWHVNDAGDVWLSANPETARQEANLVDAESPDTFTEIITYKQKTLKV